MAWQDLPPWLLYPVLIPHVAKLCIKYKLSFAAITKVNPLFEYGGLPFSSKSKMCKHFDKMLPYILVKAKSKFKNKVKVAKKFAKTHSYPVILKPDTGHRGIDVHLIMSLQDLISRLHTQKWDYILQKYCDYKDEFGIFYVRKPNEKKGKIVSMTQKIIPVLIGDGKKTFRELIDAKRIDNPTVLLERHKDKLDWVIPKGQKFKTLVQAAHSRGCMFFEANKHLTNQLSKEVERICNLPGFYFGRLDVKAKSVQALERGEFKIIEVNGATSEFVHVYDSKFTYLEGINELKRQWTLLFEIVNINRQKRTGLNIQQFIKKYIQFFLQTKSVIGKLW